MKIVLTGLLALGLVTAAAVPEAAARKKRSSMHRLVGMWQCKLGNKVLALGILPNGRLGLETLSGAYRLRPGKLQVFQGAAWVSYPYRLKKKRRRSADRLSITLPNKKKLRCTRISTKKVRQLRGMLCSWSGSSNAYSGTSSSRSKRVYFDGRGWFTFTSESSFSSKSGLAYSKSKAKIGLYRVVGKRIVVTFHTGALGVGHVHMRQRSGRITEFKYSGTLFATALCK